MQFFENLSNAHLLHAVKEDAFKGAKDYKDISLIMCILDYVETVSRKNVEGLLQEIVDYPRDIPLFDITIKGMGYILAGMEANELVSVLTKDYWENPVKDSFAFDKYMGILEVLMIKEGFPIARVQQILFDDNPAEMFLEKMIIFSYNPFWLFGSARYKDNIDFIFQRKHVVEFDVVWIQYLFLKAKNEGKEVEYINLLPDKSVQGLEVFK